MRDDVTIRESSLRRRKLGGAVLTAVGAALMMWALAFDGCVPVLVVGVVAIFIGVALLSPVIGRPLVAPIAGLLAENVTRRRSASVIPNADRPGTGCPPDLRGHAQPPVAAAARGTCCTDSAATAGPCPVPPQILLPRPHTLAVWTEMGRRQCAVARSVRRVPGRTGSRMHPPAPSTPAKPIMVGAPLMSCGCWSFRRTGRVLTVRDGPPCAGGAAIWRRSGS